MPAHVSANDEACYLGADLGGTQLRMGAVGADGRLLGEIHSVPTGRGFGPADLASRLAELRERVTAPLGGREVAALGIGSLGVVRPGPLTQAENLPLLNGTDIVALATAAGGRRVAIENDARCFVLAEARFGAARGARDVVGLTLGTGVGCGIIVGGQLVAGIHREAGEAWRIPLRGEPVESHVSGAGVVRAYHAGGGSPEIADAAAVAARRSWATRRRGRPGAHSEQTSASSASVPRRSWTPTAWCSGARSLARGCCSSRRSVRR